MEEKSEQRARGAVLMILSAMSFSMMQIVIAKTADTIPLFEQLFFRNLFAAMVAYIGLRKKGLRPLGGKENRKLLVMRSASGYLGMMTLFYASAHAAQGDVAVINKMSPFIVTAAACVFLKEKIGKHQITGLVLAFSGALIVSNPQFHSDLFPIFVAILSAVFSGIAYVFVSALKGKEDPMVIIFFFSAFSTVLTSPFMLMDLTVPCLWEFILLLFIGIFAALGQLCLTYSYACAKASEVSIYNYSGIIFSMIFGSVFLGQPVKATSAMGGILVISAGLVVFFGNRKRGNT